jgi:hypothetical protein
LKNLLKVLIPALVGMLLIVGVAQAHYPPKSKAKAGLVYQHEWLHKAKGHSQAVIKHGKIYREVVWHRKALKRINRALARVHRQMAPKPPHWSYWRNAQIRLANKIAPLHEKDAWPNCPDPYFGGGSWDDTMHCEAKGTFQSIGVRAWSVDPPGYYRCALQFDPSWERKYNVKVCP